MSTRAALRAPRAPLLALLAWLGTAGCAPSSPAVPPHVVLVVCEGLRADQLELYGHAAPAAPQLTSWAQRSLVFERATAPSNATRPAVHALFTGRHPAADRRLDQLQRLPDDEAVLPEVLAAAGYQTVAISSSPLVSVALGAARGFESFVDLGWSSDVAARPAPDEPGASDDPDPVAEAEAAATAKWVQTAMTAVCPKPPESDVGSEAPAPVTAGDLVDRVESLLRARSEQRDRSRPLFLFLHVSDCRLPADAPIVGADAARAALGERIAALDVALVRLNGLTAQLLPDRPVVTVLTADHGQWLGEGRPARFGAGNGEVAGEAFGPELLHVPLVVRGVGVTGRVAARVGLIDVLPTLAALARAAAPANIDGVSLLGFPGEGAAAPEVRATAGRVFVAYRALPGPGVQGAGELAVLRDGWRAERHGETLRLVEEASGEDVTAYRADLLPALGSAAAQWFAHSVQRSTRAGLARASAHVEAPPDVALKLEALGYVVR